MLLAGLLVGCGSGGNSKGGVNTNIYGYKSINIYSNLTKKYIDSLVKSYDKLNYPNLVYCPKHASQNYAL